MTAQQVSEFSIPPEMKGFVSSAISRLAYIFKDLKLEATSDGVRVTGSDQFDVTMIGKEISYQVYREKIFQETLGMRQDLYRMLAQ